MFTSDSAKHLFCHPPFQKCIHQQFFRSNIWDQNLHLKCWKCTGPIFLWTLHPPSVWFAHSWKQWHFWKFPLKYTVQWTQDPSDWQADPEEKAAAQRLRSTDKKFLCVERLPLLGSISTQNHRLGPHSYRILTCTRYSCPPGHTDRCLGQQQYPSSRGKKWLPTRNDTWIETL